MPDYSNLQHDIELLLALMDSSIDKVETSATSIQNQVYKLVQQKLLSLDTKNGNIDVSQKWQRTLASLDDEIWGLFNTGIWSNTISEYLSTFQTIQDRNISLNRTYNELQVATSLLSPARKSIYDLAKANLTEGLKLTYIEPANMLLMQQITAGASITDSLKLLEKWNKGDLTQTGNIKTPNLQKYATQISRDSSYAVDRAISSIIKERYQLDDVMYVGGLVRDSRPFCVHMVQHEQPVPMETVAEYIRQYPQGLYPDTTIENFMQRCGGYACRHKAFAVRKRTTSI